MYNGNNREKSKQLVNKISPRFVWFHIIHFLTETEKKTEKETRKVDVINYLWEVLNYRAKGKNNMFQQGCKQQKVGKCVKKGREMLVNSVSTNKRGLIQVNINLHDCLCWCMNWQLKVVLVLLLSWLSQMHWDPPLPHQISCPPLVPKWHRQKASTNRYIIL